MAQVTFLPGPTTAHAAPGESLFEIGRRAGLPIPTACVGRANCGLCRVRIVSGEQHLSPLGPPERRHLGNVYFITHERLSCQARLLESAEQGAKESAKEGTAAGTEEGAVVIVEIPA
jgi:ferredoxin